MQRDHRRREGGAGRSRAVVGLAGSLLVAWCGATTTAVAITVLISAREVTVGDNVVVSRGGPAAIIDENSSPAVVRSPRDQQILAAVNSLDSPAYSAIVNWSIDGGLRWGHSSLPLPAGKDRPFAPDAAFGPDGTLYVSYVNLEGITNDPENLWLARSTDGGRSFGGLTRVAGRHAFQARVTADGNGVVYLTWLQAGELGLLTLVGPPRPVVTVRSTDGGRSFSAPVQVSDPDRERVGAASPVVASDGSLAVLYEDFRRDARDFQNLEGPVWDGPFALVVTRSRDGGRSWSPGVEVDRDVAPIQRFLVYLPAFPAIAAGPDRSLYVTWSDARNGDPDVFVRRSGDGGASWEAPVRVNDNPTRDGTAQTLPTVSVAPSGRVDVGFLDRRHDPHGTRAEAYLASSTDDGRSFRNTRVSSAAFDTRIGSVVQGAPQVPPSLGTRIGLTSDDRHAYVVWTDTRQGTLDNGRQDITGALVDVPDVRGTIWRTATVAGAVFLVVLAVAGLFWWRWRQAG